MQKAFKSIDDILRAHKLRVTKIRTSVLEIFQSTSFTLSQKRIEDTLAPVDRVTLYRTLKSFEDHGIIHKVPTEDNQIHYGLCLDQCESGKHNHNHAHLTCISCDEVFCLEMEQPKIQTIETNGFIVNKAEVLLEGYCPECKKKPSVN